MLLFANDETVFFVIIQFDLVIFFNFIYLPLKLLGEKEVVRESVAELARNLEEFTNMLTAKRQEADAKEKHGSEFENAKMLALLWLCQMEARLDEFQPVAIHVDKVESQIKELQVSSCNLLG